MTVAFLVKSFFFNEISQALVDRYGTQLRLRKVKSSDHLAFFLCTCGAESRDYGTYRLAEE